MQTDGFWNPTQTKLNQTEWTNVWYHSSLAKSDRLRLVPDTAPCQTSFRMARCYCGSGALPTDETIIGQIGLLVLVWFGFVWVGVGLGPLGFGFGSGLLFVGLGA